MFPREHRLGSEGAAFTIKRGKGLSGPFLRMKGTQGRGNTTRATVVIGLTVHKRATARNLIKRRIREILRPLLPSIQPPVNLMIFAGKGADTRTFQQLREELIALCKRARLV